MPAVPMAAEWKVEEVGREEEDILFDWAKEPVRLAGIVAHGWLERIADDELRGWDAARVHSLRKVLEKELQRRGVAPQGLERATSLVATALVNALSDERGRWVLGPHKMARNEFRLRSSSRSFRIDRWFEDADGKKWVVDYKASAHEGAGLEDFLDEQQKRYAAQLDEYARALGGAEHGLYFPVQKGWRSW